jgi:hypothetical protein
MLLVLRGIHHLLAKRGISFTHIGKAGQIRSASKKFLRIFFLHCASPIGGVRIAGSIVLAQHRENKRIGKSQKTIHSALRIVIEIA